MEDRPPGDCGGGEEKTQDQYGCEHETEQRIAAHVRTLPGQIAGTASSGPPRLPSVRHSVRRSRALPTFRG